MDEGNYTKRTFKNERGLKNYTIKLKITTKRSTMINYQLYIENQLIDVDEKLSFPLNKIFGRIERPNANKGGMV